MTSHQFAELYFLTKFGDRLERLRCCKICSENHLTVFPNVIFVIYSSDPWQYGEILLISTRKFGHVYTG
jgi:hypothetical protein